MSIYLVRVASCDDANEVLVDLTDAEHEVIARVAELITAASTSTCKPTMDIQTATAQDIADFQEEDQ